jgi:hypothetical protein
VNGHVLNAPVADRHDDNATENMLSKAIEEHATSAKPQQTKKAPVQARGSHRGGCLPCWPRASARRPLVDQSMKAQEEALKAKSVVQRR